MWKVGNRGPSRGEARRVTLTPPPPPPSAITICQPHSQGPYALSPLILSTTGRSDRCSLLWKGKRAQLLIVSCPRQLSSGARTQTLALQDHTEASSGRRSQVSGPGNGEFHGHKPPFLSFPTPALLGSRPPALGCHLAGEHQAQARGQRRATSRAWTPRAVPPPAQIFLSLLGDSASRARDASSLAGAVKLGGGNSVPP